MALGRLPSLGYPYIYPASENLLWDCYFLHLTNEKAG